MIYSKLKFDLKIEDLNNYISFGKKFYIMCKYNNEEIILECGYIVLEEIVKNYKKDNNSYLITIKVDKFDYNAPFNKINSFLNKNIYLDKYETNKNIIEFINDLKKIRSNIIHNNYKIINEFLSQFNLSINYFKNKLRTKKLLKLND